MGKTPEIDNKDRVTELVTPDKSLPNSGSADVPVPAPPVQSPIRCGYYVGVSEDGTIRFDVVGSQQNLTDLLGLHQVAAEKIQSIVDKHQGGKFTYLMKQMSLLDGKLSQLLKIMGQLTAVADLEGNKSAGNEEAG